MADNDMFRNSVFRNSVFRSSLRHLLIFSVLLLVALPALAQYGRRPSRANEIRVRFGLFQPDGNSEYWQFGELGDPASTVFTGEPSDFEDLIVGAEFVRYLGSRLGFVLGASGWTGEQDQAYLFFEDQFGDDIVHRTRVEVGAVTAGLVLNLVDRNRRLVPYVGAGGGFYIWNLEETGDFVDFGAVPLEIFSTRFTDDGETFGWYWNAGLRVGITRNWSFYGEYRKHDAKDSLSGDFEGFGDLDLSGNETSGGFVWTF
jgi:opacity protein-like surface antigen